MSFLTKHGVIRVVRTLPWLEGRSGAFFGGGFMHKEDARTVYRNRRFPRFVVIYVESGSGWYVDATQTRHRIEAGQVIQMPAFEPLSLIHDVDGLWMEWFLEFDPAWVAAASASGVLDAGKPVLSPGTNPKVEVRLSRLLSNVERSPNDPRHSGEALSIWLEWWHAHLSRQAAAGATPAEKRLSVASHRLGEQLESRRSIQHLLGLSRPAYDQLRREFSARFGMSPGRYRILKRIEAAKAALLDPRKQVKEVAFSLGYPDSMSFSKQFHQETGQSPRAYRRSFYRD